MSSANSPTSPGSPGSTPPSAPPQPTLETVSEQISNLEGKLDSLPVSQTPSPKPARIGHVITIIASIIAASGSITAAIMSARTNSELSRINTIKVQIATKDSETYTAARDDIATIEQAFETFLFIKRIDPQTDPYKSANDLDKMVTVNRFESYTDDIRQFNDFIVEAIAALQKNSTGFKDADTLRNQAREKCHKAVNSLDYWIGLKKTLTPR